MLILPENTHLQYSGRIDFEDKNAPVFIYPCSWVKMNFTKNTLKVVVENHHECWNNYLGYILDGVQGKLLLSRKGKEEIEIPVDKKNEEHELLLFKRQDACHLFTFLGFLVEDDCVVKHADSKPKKKIEVYGDSVSAGEVSEAIDYVGKEDPKHNGEYSNSWYSYAWMTARKLGAEIHDIAQGGISLLNKTGWFCAPEYIGMEDTYDKLNYNPHLGSVKPWDFTKYRPHVVIVAIGQNDNHPEDYMAAEPKGVKAKYWKEHYEMLIRNLRLKYPKSVLILTTTILNHAKEWDDAIEEVCQKVNDSNLFHFLYTRNAAGTPGHIRISEAEEMSDELSAFIESLGQKIWEAEE
ncbi:electron transporter RnfD [Lachnotalea glycerini]|nr:electron transporter RnfD [Lachnotalea glycerini]